MIKIREILIRKGRRVENLAKKLLISAIIVYFISKGFYHLLTGNINSK